MELKRTVNQDYHHFISQAVPAAFKTATEGRNTTYHVLFSDEALDVTIGEGFLKSLRESGVLCVAIEGHHSLACLAQFSQGHAIRSPGCHLGERGERTWNTSIKPQSLAHVHQTTALNFIWMINDAGYVLKMYLISLIVCRRWGQGDGAMVCWCSVLFRQFRAQGFVGHLDLCFQVFQKLIHPVLGDGFTVPVFKIFNIFRHRIRVFSAFWGLYFCLQDIEMPNSLLSPLPLNVFATMHVGLPWTCWACQKALHSSSTLWPSTT